MITTTLLRISLSTLVCGVACAETIQVQGAGATFPAPIYMAWLAAYNADHPESHIDYQAIGSGGGIRGITDKTVQFAGSDAPLTNEQMAAAPGIMHLPTVAGPVVITYNLPALNAPLILDGATIAGMYLGTISKWNDAAIAKLNPGVALPDTDVVVVHRSDGSGTTWIFTNYLAKVSQEWGKVGNATSVKWPAGLGGKGNAGVADAVRNAQGAIGYVELAYAKDAKLPQAKLVNHDGKVVEASIQGVVEAAKHSPRSQRRSAHVHHRRAGRRILSDLRFHLPAHLPGPLLHEGQGQGGDGVQVHQVVRDRRSDPGAHDRGLQRAAGRDAGAGGQAPRHRDLRRRSAR